jgi:hypothetical protein
MRKKKDENSFPCPKTWMKRKGWNSFIKENILEKKHEWEKKGVRGGGGLIKFRMEKIWMNNMDEKKKEKR